jgi:hypothetical protein
VPEQAPAATGRADLAGEYFEQLRGRFDLAAAAVGGPGERDLEMAGLRLRLRCAGEPMGAALLPPFEHLAAAGSGAPELTISLFDTASTGVDPPPPVWEPIEAAPGTNPVARLRSPHVSILAAAGSGALTAVESTAGEAIFHLTDAGQVPASERAAPLRDALQLLMAARDRWLTHAGAVGRGGRGVLLVGRGGSGKSTLALSCALAGMEIVADDYVLLEPGESPVAHAMQSTAKLTEDSAARLGLGSDAIDGVGFEPTMEGPAKALVEIRTIAPGSMTRRLEITAVVAPVLPPLTSRLVPHTGIKGEVSEGGGELNARWRSISAAQGLRAMAPSTIVQSGFQGASSLAALADLVRRVPSYELALSSDPAANAAAVDRLVGELG